MGTEGLSKNKIRDFRDLFAWQEGHKLVLIIYESIKFFPKEEEYGLKDQLRRAVVSVTSNIAEGFGLRTYKEKLRFYFIAQGSLTEVKNQIIIAKDVGYIHEESFDKIMTHANLVHKILQGLISKTKAAIKYS